MQQVIPLADELSPENFNLVFNLLFSLCDTNMAKYTTSYLTILAIMRNGNDEMITQTMQFVDLSDTIVVGELIPSLSKNVRSKLSTQLLERFLEENTPVASKSAAIGLIEQFSLVHPIDADWIVDASEHSTISTLLDFLLHKDTNTQSIVEENLDYIIFLHQLIKLDTFGKLWEYLNLCSGQVCYKIMDKLIKIFPDDRRFPQMIISISTSSDQKLVLNAAWSMTESGLPFYKDALLAVAHRLLITKELSYTLDLLDYGHIVLRKIGCYLNQFSDKECVEYRNLILESLHEAGYSRARIIASALE